MDNFANNSAGYQIMPNQEPCKDEAVRSHLLSHIYSKHELKTRFIYGLGSGEAIFNVDAALEYVALYNEYVANVVAVIHIGSGMPARGGELETYIESEIVTVVQEAPIFGAKTSFSVLNTAKPDLRTSVLMKSHPFYFLQTFSWCSHLRQHWHIPGH